MSFVRALLSSDDLGADSVVFAMLLCVVTLCGLAVYLAVFNVGALPQLWGFGGPAVTIIGATAITKGVRDKLAPALEQK